MSLAVVQFFPNLKSARAGKSDPFLYRRRTQLKLAVSQVFWNARAL